MTTPVAEAAAITAAAASGPFRHGLVLGKFYPPHAGHHFLIDRAAAQCDRLTVLVAGATVETIPLALRHRWLAERHPYARVISVRDDVLIDMNDPEIWDAHIEIWRRAVGEPVDAVFSSEAYGPELARRMDAASVLVDPDRIVYPVSGTAVRADPAAHWHMLSPAVRAYLTRRVVICGAESTGTSTLSRALAAHYATEWVREYGREHTYRKQQDGTVDHWTEEDFVVIAARQQLLEDLAARTASPVLICDTDAIATCLFEELYLGAADATTRQLALQRTPALYVLTSHEGVPFDDDGTRLFEHRRAWMTDRFRQTLAAQPAPWIEVRGTHQQRMLQVKAAIDTILTDGWHFAAPLG